MWVSYRHNEIHGKEHSKSLNVTIFAYHFDPNIQSLGAKQPLQVLKSSLALKKYAKKHPRVCKTLFNLFFAEKRFVALINTARFCTLVSILQVKALLLYWTSQP